MSLQIEARLNGENQEPSVGISGFETSPEILFNIEDISKLSPGTNIFEVDIQGDSSASITGNMIEWDLISNAPKLRDTIKKRQQLIPIDESFNDNLTDIFNHEYLNPRSPYCSLQIATDGHAHWCYPNQPAPNIDDSLLRDSVDSEGIFVTDAGILFKQALRDGGKNVAFVSLWDNFPSSVTIPIGQKASKIYLLVAGSTNPMQSQVVNARATVIYDDGTSTSLDLINPDNYRSLEATYESDVDGFCLPKPSPHFVRLGNVNAQLLDIVLEDKVTKELKFECIANEVVVGLLGVTSLLKSGEDVCG